MRNRASIPSVILCIWLGLMGGKAAAQIPEETPVPRGLLLYSNDRLLPAGVRIDEGFRDALGQLRKRKGPADES